MFEYCKPEEAGVDSRGIARFLDEMKEKHLHMHNVMMLRHGKVIVDTSFEPWNRDKKHMLFSLTKSFTSTAMGFAVQDGLLKTDDLLIDFFPELLTNEPCENMRKMTVKHLLTMNTGHDVEPQHVEDNWERYFLRTYIAYEPGTHFLYNTYGTYMVAAIVQKVTGKKLVDYLREKLFDPLEMSSDIWTEESPTGIAIGGHGLNVRVEDIAKLGQFYLQKGKWNGKQLLNEEWIRDAQTPWSDNSAWGGGPDWNSGYGYQFWMCVPNNVFRGDGAFGQYCVMCPDQDMVIAINSGVDDMAAVLRSIWENVLPAVDRAGDDGAELRARLENPVTPAEWEENGLQAGEPAVEKKWIGAYQLNPDNALKLDRLEVNDGSITLQDRSGRRTEIPLSLNVWQHVQLKPGEPGAENYYSETAVRAARIRDELVLHFCHTLTPFEDMLHITFSEHGLVIRGRRRVGGDKGHEIIGYRL